MCFCVDYSFCHFIFQKFIFISANYIKKKIHLGSNTTNKILSAPIVSIVATIATSVAMAIITTSADFIKKIFYNIYWFIFLENRSKIDIFFSVLNKLNFVLILCKTLSIK